jgi:threonine dehydrogenase-like Zn-dependent dehydrogenase
LKVGGNVKHLVPGDLVVPTVRRPCGDPSCVACAVGRQDFCFTGKFKERGINRLHGFLTGIIVEESKYLHKIPPELRHIAVLVEPLTISAKALRQILDIQGRLPWGCPVDSRGGRQQAKTPNLSCRRALVLGAGPVGLLGAMTLLNEGFETLIYSRLGSEPKRLEISKAIGAEFIAAEDKPVEELSRCLGEVDVILEAVGASQLAFDVLELLGPNAIFVFTGVPGRKTKITVNTDKIMRNLVLRNQALVGTVNAAPEDFENAIHSLAEFERKWPGTAESLKTHRIGLEQVSEALKSKHGIKQYVALSTDREN